MPRSGHPEPTLGRAHHGTRPGYPKHRLRRIRQILPYVVILRGNVIQQHTQGQCCLSFWPQHVLHYPLEVCRGVLQPLRHPSPVVRAAVGGEAS